MNNSRVFIVFLAGLLFVNPSHSTENLFEIDYAENLFEIDYATVVPVYIKYVTKDKKLTRDKAFNEVILARYFLALNVPHKSACMHKANAYSALCEHVADGNGDVVPKFSVTTGSVLKVALQQALNNCDDDLDTSCYASLLDQIYSEFPPVPEAELDGIKNRITLFGKSLILLENL